MTTQSTNSTGSGSSTSLVPFENTPALAAIYADLIGLAAKMMPEHVKLSLSDFRQFIEKRTIWAVNAHDEEIVGVPFVAHVAFGGESRRVGWTLKQETTAKGELIFDAEGAPKYKFVPDYEIVISGKADLPVLKKLSERVTCEVRPLRTTNGLGSLIEYVVIDEVTGAMRAGEPKLCIFIRDFNMFTGFENGDVLAIPLGLARVETIAQWNTRLARTLAQNPENAWQHVTVITNWIGRPNEYLELQPQGPRSMNGLLPVYKPREGERVDPDKWAYTIVARLGGKIAKLDKNSGPIIFKGEVAENQIFHVEEKWNVVRLTVKGLFREMKSLVMSEFKMGKIKLDALLLLGSTLYDVHPGSGGALVGKAIRTPPIDYMIGIGWLVPGTTVDVGRTTLQGMGRLLCEQVRNQVDQARRDIVHALGAAGTQSAGKPTLDEILKDDETPEALREAMNQNKDECPLATWMLASSVVKNLDLATWDWHCWVLREARKDLLMELARSQGLELPKPAAPPEGGEEGGGGEAPAAQPSTTVAAEGGNGTGKLKLPPRERKPRSKEAQG